MTETYTVTAVGPFAGQQFTSANTSINRTKLPRIFSGVAIPYGSLVYDFGSGRYVDHIRRFVESQGAEYCPFDPYNQSAATNFVSTAKALETERDVIIVCSNVLNVLTDADLAKVLRQLKKLRENFRAKAIYITVYEGDRTGIGRQTGPDQWQRNEQLGEYAARFVDMGMRVAIHRGILRVMAKEA